MPAALACGEVRIAFEVGTAVRRAQRHQREHLACNLEIQWPAGPGDIVYSARWARRCVMPSICPAASLSNW